jgi:hypothetical protein
VKTAKEENAMSALLRAVRSFDRSGRAIRPSEEGDVLAERRLRAGAPLKKSSPRRVHATALITLLGPPAASLILLAVYYFEYWRGVPFNLTDAVIVLFLIAVPEGYAFGAVPALLAALLYCALLTAHARLVRPLIRACVAGICGGLASWAWFCGSLGASGIYGLVGALVMASLSVSLPRPGAKQLMVKE